VDEIKRPSDHVLRDRKTGDDWLESRLEEWGHDESISRGVEPLAYPSVSPMYRIWQIQHNQGSITCRSTRSFTPTIPRYYCKHRIAKTRQAIASLPKRLRKALIARYVADHNGRTLEIRQAIFIGWTPKTYRARLSEAKKRLRRALDRL